MDRTRQSSHDVRQPSLEPPILPRLGITTS